MAIKTTIGVATLGILCALGLGVEPVHAQSIVPIKAVHEYEQFRERQATMLKDGYRNHRVGYGETLSQLATDNNTSVEEIATLNGLVSNDITAGNHLKIPGKQAPKEEQTNKPTVKAISTSTPSNKSGRIVTMSVSAYSSEQGSGEGLIMADGTPVYEGAIAAPPEIPFGTKIVIEGRTYTVHDRGGAIKGNHLDIYMTSTSDCIKWGRKNLPVTILD